MTSFPRTANWLYVPSSEKGPKHHHKSPLVLGSRCNPISCPEGVYHVSPSNRSRYTPEGSSKKAPVGRPPWVAHHPHPTSQEGEEEKEGWVYVPPAEELPYEVEVDNEGGVYYRPAFYLPPQPWGPPPAAPFPAMPPQPPFTPPAAPFPAMPPMMVMCPMMLAPPPYYFQPQPTSGDMNQDWEGYFGNVRRLIKVPHGERQSKEKGSGAESSAEGDGTEAETNTS